MVSLVVGKRTQEQTQTVVNDAKSRLHPGHVPAVCTDTYAGDESALLEACGHRYPQPRHSAKGRAAPPMVRWPQGLAYGHVQKISKGHRIGRVEVRAVSGKARLQQVLSLLGSTVMNTSVVERHHGTSRLRHQRTVRKTVAFSKATRSHRWMSWLAVGLDNFCRAHSSLNIKQETQVLHRSPAMAAK